MVNKQKRSANIILVIIIVILVGISLYLAKEIYFRTRADFPEGRKPLPFTTNIYQNTNLAENKKDKTADWNKYSNTRYGYVIKYPSSWYVDTTYSENDFTNRGPIEYGYGLIGGDVVWSNYQNPRKYDPSTTPLDYKAIHLLIHKVSLQTTLDSHIKERKFIGPRYYNREDININGIKGVRLFYQDPDSKDVVKFYFLKTDNKIFEFSTGSYNSDKSAKIMDDMLNTFELTKYNFTNKCFSYDISVPLSWELVDKTDQEGCMPPGALVLFRISPSIILEINYEDWNIKQTLKDYLRSRLEFITKEGSREEGSKIYNGKIFVEGNVGYVEYNSEYYVGLEDQKEFERRYYVLNNAGNKVAILNYRILSSSSPKKEMDSVSEKLLDETIASIKFKK